MEEIVYTYQLGQRTEVVRRPIHRTPTGVKVWSETWYRWVDLKAIIARPTVTSWRFIRPS